jgi:hypothetical protein
MSNHLHHLVAQQQLADRMRAAERARLTQGSRRIEPAARRDGLFAGLLVALRRRGARPVLAAADCADDCCP